MYALTADMILNNQGTSAWHSCESYE